MWLDLAIAVSCGGAGLLFGWLLHSTAGPASQRFGGARSNSIDSGEGQEEPGRERITAVARRLQTFAQSMAADVDAHQTRMQAVNNTLADGHDVSHDDVIRAVGDLIEANEEMQVQLKQAQDRIHEQTLQIESAELRAQTDALTRVPNRRAFDAHMESRGSSTAGEARTLALLDVDHFKKFNDVFGHRAGDEVLRVVANILHTRLQSYGLVARFGGEEFAIILDGVPASQAKSMVEQARLAIGERDIPFENQRLRVSASVGMAEYEAGQSIADWIQRADEALYYSKDVGRDCGHLMVRQNPVRIDIGRNGLGSSAETIDSYGGAGAQWVGQEGSPCTAGQAGIEGTDGAWADAHGLGDAFHQMRSCAEAGLPVALMAIRCHGEWTSREHRKLNRVACSSLRGVDRVGALDESTILICMPSIEQPHAMERGRRIFRSVQAIGLAGQENAAGRLGIGITLAQAGEATRAVVSRAIELADQATITAEGLLN